MTVEHDLEEAQQAWIAECAEPDGDVGLFWIVRNIGDSMPDASDEEIRRKTLSILRHLMKEGLLRAADMMPGGDFKAWEGSIDEQLERIGLNGASSDGAPTLATSSGSSDPGAADGMRRPYESAPVC